MNAHNPEMLENAAEEAAWQDNDAVVDRKSMFNNLPSLLRGFGAGIVLVAISIFLFQGWNSTNDVGRYLLLLGHTVALAVIGFLSGHYLREAKGARLLLAIALASVPANFAILGGFIYSQFAMDGFNLVYPGIASWSAGSPGSALMVTAASVALLIPVSILGFMVLNRRSSRALSMLYIASNLILLIPVRNAGIVGWSALAVAILVMTVIGRSSKHNPSLRTMDGLLARIVQFIPVGVLVGRCIWLYSADAFMITVLSMMVFLLLRHITLSMDREDNIRNTLEIFSMIPAFMVGLGVADMVLRALPAINGIFPGVFSLVTSALIVEISLRCAKDGAGYRRIAAGILSVSMLFNLWMFGGVFLAGLSMAIGLTVAIYGYMKQQSLVLGMGVATLLTGLIYQIVQIVHYFNLGGWTSLAVLGVVSILVGSAIERHGDRIKLRTLEWGHRLREWRY